MTTNRECCRVIISPNGTSIRYVRTLSRIMMKLVQKRIEDDEVIFESLIFRLRRRQISVRNDVCFFDKPLANRYRFWTLAVSFFFRSTWIAELSAIKHRADISDEGRWQSIQSRWFAECYIEYFLFSEKRAIIQKAEEQRCFRARRTVLGACEVMPVQLGWVGGK